MKNAHAVVWVDHHEAKILGIHVSAGAERDAGFESEKIHGPHGQTHNKRHDDGHRHTLDAQFAERIAQALAGASEVLVCGPGAAKDELMAHLRAKHAAVAAKVVAVEAIDHPTEGQLADHARKVFGKIDRMKGTHVR